jgi:flavin reductase (DIM6/NTAB) family NADH-FMN oxidoreductase RutF
MPIDDARFKEAMSRFASGVTVVTAEHEGALYGMTVASFASLSLHPPLVIICIEKSVKTHEAIRAAGRFGVSILASTQADVSGKFASKADDKFSGVNIRRGENGLPLIDGAICTLECRVHEQFAGGDHSIFVGEVLDAQTASDGAPLVYYRSAYREIS